MRQDYPQKDDKGETFRNPRSSHRPKHRTRRMARADAQYEVARTTKPMWTAAIHRRSCQELQLRSLPSLRCTAKLLRHGLPSMERRMGVFNHHKKNEPPRHSPQRSSSISLRSALSLFKQPRHPGSKATPLNWPNHLRQIRALCDQRLERRLNLIRLAVERTLPTTHKARRARLGAHRFAERAPL